MGKPKTYKEKTLKPREPGSHRGIYKPAGQKMLDQLTAEESRDLSRPKKKRGK